MPWRERGVLLCAGQAKWPRRGNGGGTHAVVKFRSLAVLPTPPGVAGISLTLFQNSIWNLSAELEKIGVTGEIGVGGAVEADDIPPIRSAVVGYSVAGHAVAGHSLVGHCEAKVCIGVLQEP
jgi:hypothetical protein